MSSVPPHMKATGILIALVTIVFAPPMPLEPERTHIPVTRLSAAASPSAVMPPHELPPAVIWSRSNLSLYGLSALAASATTQSTSALWSACVVDGPPPPDVRDRTIQPPEAHLSNSGLNTASLRLQAPLFQTKIGNFPSILVRSVGRHMLKNGATA